MMIIQDQPYDWEELNEGETSESQTERRFIQMWKYTQDVTRHGQQGEGVTTTAVPQLPQ